MKRRPEGLCPKCGKPVYYENRPGIYGLVCTNCWANFKTVVKLIKITDQQKSELTRYDKKPWQLYEGEGNQKRTRALNRSIEKPKDCTKCVCNGCLVTCSSKVCLGGKPKNSCTKIFCSKSGRRAM